MTGEREGRDYEGHRCDGSLGARCSIRRYRPDARSPSVIHHRDGHWNLWVRAYDYEWLVDYMRWVARIEYCPFCGKEL